MSDAKQDLSAAHEALSQAHVLITQAEGRVKAMFKAVQTLFGHDAEITKKFSATSSELAVASAYLRQVAAVTDHPDTAKVQFDPLS